MEIKLKLRDLLKANYALENILDNHENEKIDALFKFKILGILKEFEKYVSNYNQIRNEKIQLYGKQDKNGDTIIPLEDTEAIQKFGNELNPILDSEVQINLQSLEPEDIFARNLHAKILIALYPIIKEN